MWTYYGHVSIQANLSCGGTNSLEHNINCLMSPTIIRSTLCPQHQCGATDYFTGLKTETTCLPGADFTLVYAIDIPAGEPETASN